MSKRLKARKLRSRSRSLIGVAAASLTAFPFGAALAQEGAVPMEVIIVTAQKRSEKLQEVPVAVKAFSTKQIEDAGIKNTQDFVNLTPNMSIDNAQDYANTYVVLRGLSSFNNADIPVAVVVDGVPLNDQKQLKMSLVDIERIEVLKGPQGALYGRNAIGGAIVIDSKQPKNKLEGFVKADIASFNSKELAGGVSGAIVPDKVMFRIVGQTKSADSTGIAKNSFSGKPDDFIDHDNSVRAKLTVVASDDVTLDFRLTTQDYLAAANWDSILRDGNPNKIVAPEANLRGEAAGKTNEFSFKAEVNTQIGTITAITGYLDLKTLYRGDLDFSNPANPLGGIFGPPLNNTVFPPVGIFGTQLGQGQDRRVKMFSQELRITSRANQPLRWIAGGYYSDSTRDMTQHVFKDVTSSLDQWSGNGLFLQKSDNQYKSKATAVFGQIDYDLNAQTTLSGALRYDSDDRSRSDLATGQMVSKKFDDWQPKITLTRHLDADSIAYATYSTGFRSGGFNGTTSAVPAFTAETLRNYEIGYKSTFLNKRMTFNIAAFDSTSTNFQYFHVSNFGQIIDNLDKVNLRGMDLDLRFAPIRGLEFDAGLGVTESTIKANAANPSLVGNHSPKNSPWKLNLGAQYTTPIGNGMLGFGRFEVEQRSKKYWHPDNLLVSDGFALYGMRLGVRQEKDKWSVNLYGRNLTNKQYYADVNGKTFSGWPAPVGSIGALAPGRVVGVDATFKF
ncbi:MAG: TonB-dependent receptor [Proteobacteria bacterium]|nr:TonB-dependent receptor [Pseudomonadota bacterium]